MTLLASLFLFLRLFTHVFTPLFKVFSRNTEKFSPSPEALRWEWRLPRFRNVTGTEISKDRMPEVLHLCGEDLFLFTSHNQNKKIEKAEIRI